MIRRQLLRDQIRVKANALGSLGVEHESNSVFVPRTTCSRVRKGRLFTYFWYSQLFRLSDEELASLGMTDESIRRLRCVVDKRPTSDELPLPLPLPLPIPSVEKSGQNNEPVEVSNSSFDPRGVGPTVRLLPSLSRPPSTRLTRSRLLV